MRTDGMIGLLGVLLLLPDTGLAQPLTYFSENRAQFYSYIKPGETTGRVFIEFLSQQDPGTAQISIGDKLRSTTLAPMKQANSPTWRADLGYYPRGSQLKIKILQRTYDLSVNWIDKPVAKKPTIRATPELKIDEGEVSDMKFRISQLPSPGSVSPAISEFRKSNKIYVSLTTSPSRLPHIHHTLGTLDLDLVEKILVVLPRRYGRLEESYQIPPNLAEWFPKIQYLRPDMDIGPASKIIPALEWVAKSSYPCSMVVSIDDDTAYPKSLIHELVYAKTQQPEAIIGTFGQNLDRWNISPFGLPKIALPADQGWLTPVDMLEGFAGIVYQPQDLDTTRIRQWIAASRNTLVSDDLSLALGAAFASTPRLMLKTPFLDRSKIWPFPFGYLADSLNKGRGFDGDSTISDVNEIKYRLAYNDMLESWMNWNSLQPRVSPHSL